MLALAVQLVQYGEIDYQKDVYLILIPHVILTALEVKSGLVEVKMQQTEFARENLSVVVLMRMPWSATEIL